MRHKLRLFNLILIVVLIFSFTACTTPKAAAETTTVQTTIAETAAPEFGFLRNVFYIDKEKIEETGAAWLRPNFGYFVWGVMQKDENASIDFSKTDEVVYNSQKHGLHLLITLFPFADWDQKAYGEKCKVSANDGMLPQKKGGF